MMAKQVPAVPRGHKVCVDHPETPGSPELKVIMDSGTANDVSAQCSYIYIHRFVHVHCTDICTRCLASVHTVLQARDEQNWLKRGFARLRETPFLRDNNNHHGVDMFNYYVENIKICAQDPLWLKCTESLVLFERYS